MFRRGGGAAPGAAAVAVSLLGLAAISVLGVVPAAYAATTTVLSMTTCNGIAYPDLHGSWSSGTCTLTTTYTILSGDTLEVPSGTTLAISGNGEVQVNNGGASAFLTVDSGGTINVESSGNGYGIYNDVAGTITNSGTINVENSGIGGIGIFNNGGTITDSGTINVENSNGLGIDNGATITVVDCGVITVTGSGNTVPSPLVYSRSGSCRTSGVPEFPFGLVLLLTLLAPVLAVLRKRALPPGSLAT